VADAESPTLTSGCDPQTVATDGAVAFTCTASSAGGTTNQPVTIRRDSTPPSSPTFTGIRAGTLKRLPAGRNVGCRADDATSGVASCVVRGFSRKAGRHRLRAVATDESGLSSSATLTYRIRAAAARLRIPRKQSIGTVLRDGFECSLQVAANRTTLVAALKVGKTTVGKLKARRNRGKRKLQVQLSRAGRAKLAGAATAELKLVVKARSRGTAPATVRGKRTLKR
jgi:hypothetical protein